MSGTFQFQIKGLDELYKKLGKVQATDILVAPTERAQIRVHGEMMRYPPARQGSSYIRTNTLMRRWTKAPVQRMSNGVRGVIGNNTLYAPFVQDERMQAHIHMNYWETDFHILTRLAPVICRDFEWAITQALSAP